MKIEDYFYFVNGKETTFDKWLIALKKMSRTDLAYEVSKKRALEKIENDSIIYGWNIEQKSTGIHLRIQRKDYKGDKIEI